MIFASSRRSEPAAELRGFAKSGSPASSRAAFSRAKDAFDMYTSPRTSSSRGI